MIAYVLLEPLQYADLGYGKAVLAQGTSEGRPLDVAIMLTDFTHELIGTALRRQPTGVPDGPARVKLLLKFIIAMKMCGMTNGWAAQEKITADDLAALLRRR